MDDKVNGCAFGRETRIMVSEIKDGIKRLEDKFDNHIKHMFTPSLYYVSMVSVAIISVLITVIFNLLK